MANIKLKKYHNCLWSTRVWKKESKKKLWYLVPGFDLIPGKLDKLLKEIIDLYQSYSHVMNQRVLSIKVWLTETDTGLSKDI